MKETKIVLQKLKSNNGHMKVRSVETSLKDLGMDTDFIIDSIDENTIKHNDEIFHALNMRLWHENINTIIANDIIYVNSAKRPSAAKIKDHLLRLLSEDFPNDYEIVVGRYLFRIDRLPIPIIRTLLKLCKDGDGKLIDYSWIAPLQELKMLASIGLREKVMAKKKAIQSKSTLSFTSKGGPVFVDRAEVAKHGWYKAYINTRDY